MAERMFEELFVSFGSPYEENRGPCANCWVMCWFPMCMGKRNRQFLFSRQIRVDWHTMGIRETHVAETLRKGWGAWLCRKGEFSKAQCLYSSCVFFRYSILPTKFCDPSLSTRLVGVRCDCAPVDQSPWVFAHSHAQHNTLILTI